MYDEIANYIVINIVVITIVIVTVSFLIGFFIGRKNR